MKPLFVLVVSTACIFGHPQTKEGCHKIVGGENVNIEDFPYMVQLLYKRRFDCGGSIISPDWVISAAHCTQRVARFYSIRAGTSLTNKGGILVRIKKIYNHPQFDPKTADNDICVIGLREPLTFGSTINKISLPLPYEEEPTGSTAVVSGWGDLSPGGPQPDRLQAVRVNVFDTNKCKELYDPVMITDNMFCAGVLEGAIGPCKGDSGSALAVNGTLIGVVSWGLRCPEPNHPAVFTKVSHYRDFINQTTGI